MLPHFTLAASFVFPAGMAWAGLHDVTTMTIQNRLVLFLAGAYFALAPLAEFGLALIGWSVVVAALVLVSGFALFALGWIGGGDAKLAAVAALWVGPALTLEFVIWTAIAGGALTLALLGLRALPLPAFGAHPPWLARLHAHTTGVPYGAAMAVAAIAVFPQSAWIATQA